MMATVAIVSTAGGTIRYMVLIYGIVFRTGWWDAAMFLHAPALGASGTLTLCRVAYGAAAYFPFVWLFLFFPMSFFVF